MILSKLARGMLFCAGMMGGATSGNLFYLERYMAGGAMLVLTAMFLFFSMADLTRSGRSDGEEFWEALDEQRRVSAALGLLLADYAVDGYKHIGRTIPGIPAELNKLEDDIVPLLNSLKVNRTERDRILQEIEKLRTRARQGEGRRALTGGRL